MSRKFKVWLDSGANIHSRYEQVISLDEIGYDDDDWDEMTEDERGELMREIAFERSDWGFEEVED